MSAPQRRLVDSDPWLKPYEKQLAERERYFTLRKFAIEAMGSLEQLSRSHEFFGFHRGERDGETGVWFREWAPAAKALYLTGEFNNWSRDSHPLAREAQGVWSIFVPDNAPEKLIHGSRLKVRVITDTFGSQDRIPTYCRRAIQDPATGDFAGQYWSPPEPYQFQFRSPESAFVGSSTTTGSLRIYEAHVGMACEEPRVGTYREFTDHVLPRIAKLGYNAVQLMAIQEHPYYGSFGYHVSNFFAASSRFGTPEDLKTLIDKAHGLGLQVFLDLVHSHAVKNTLEGLNRFDGTLTQFFHPEPRGLHPAWDSLVFDYGKREVIRFLLSNVRFWLEEYRFDGLRFDGVTSMLYLDHGLGKTFSSYNDYFGKNIDEDAIVYLKLANLVAHSVSPEIVTIAEDVSGMVGCARPVAEGGLGFDYRLAMGVPDAWIKLLKEQPDEEWHLGGLYSLLLNRRRDEKHIGYAESHDQALVGDQTIAFRLMKDEMYWNMAKTASSPVIDRGVALHKLIRLITFALSGEAWLNFMGNEFGHPEWIDFPREGNDFSYHYARRQWSLADRTDLHYRELLEFDRAMQALDVRFNVLASADIRLLLVHEDAKVLVFSRGELVFVINFHPSASYADLRIPVPETRDYEMILDSDSTLFGGKGRVRSEMTYPWQATPAGECAQSIQLYLPNRSAQVLKPK